MEERHQKCLRNLTADGGMAKERYRFLNKRRPEQDMQIEKENTHKVNDIGTLFGVLYVAYLYDDMQH